MFSLMFSWNHHLLRTKDEHRENELHFNPTDDPVNITDVHDVEKLQGKKHQYVFLVECVVCAVVLMNELIIKHN